MLAGRVDGKKTSLSSMFEAVGAYKAGKIDENQLCVCEENTCATCGSCSGMYTANSMNCLAEAIGIALPGNGTIPAVSGARVQLAKHAGMAIMNLVEKDIKARDIINEKSIRNALACDMALGCSSNSVLHLLCLVHAPLPFHKTAPVHNHPLQSLFQTPVFSDSKYQSIFFAPQHAFDIPLQK